MARTLTAKQASFVTHYVECGNGAEAVRLAGYASKHPEKMASQLRGNDAISEAIEKLQGASAAAAIVTPRLIMEGLLSEARDQENSGAERISAWRALQAMVPGALQPRRLEHTGEDGGAINVKGLSRETVDTVKREFLGIKPEDKPAQVH